MMIRRLIACAVLMTFLQGLGAQALIDVDTVIGFNGLAKTGRHNPLVVSITNNGKDITGDLVVQVRRGTTFRTDRIFEFRRRVSLPSQSRKRISFSVPLTSSGVPVSVWIEQGGEIIHREEISILGRVIHSPLLLAIGRTASFNFLTVGQDIVVVYPHVEMLPDRWDAYDPVDFVAIHNADLSAMTREQAVALEKWVDSGGSLLVSGGTHLVQQPEALDRLMPVRIMGLARTGSFSALEDYLGVKIESDGDVPVSMGNARRGQVIVSQDGIPLLVHQKKGEGNILFFAGDIGTHPFSRDAVRKALWSAFEQVHVGRDPFDEPGSIFEDPVLPDLLDLENERQYSRVLLLGFLLVYLTGTLYFTLRTPRTEVPTDVQTDAQAEVRTKSRHLGRWISIIILSVGLSLAGHLLFARNVFRNEYAMIDRTVIKPTLGGRYSIARKDVVLVSITDRSYTVTLDAVDSVVLGRKQGYTRVREGSVVAVEDIAVSTWNQQSYTFLTSVEFSLDGSLVRSGDRLDLKITNSSDSTILDALLIYRGVPSLIGTMSPGDHHSSSFEIVSSPIGKIREDATTFSRETDPARYLTLNAILKDPTYRESMESGAVILLGWLSDPIVHASTGDEFISYQEVSILVSEIAFPLPKAGHKE